MPNIRPRRSRGGGALPGFLVGCLAMLILGAVLGLLLAPQRGEVTRRRILRRAGAARDDVIDKVEDLMVHRSEDVADADEEAAR
jgi:gas vesicle protein